MPVPDSAFKGSLLFTAPEVAAIDRALAGQVSGTAALTANNGQVIPLRRLIVVSGIAYQTADDWVVWINGQKVTPKKLLPEIVDIDVTPASVQLKWFDIGINNVISITMRPHQTYDIVTGVLLSE